MQSALSMTKSKEPPEELQLNMPEKHPAQTQKKPRLDLPPTKTTLPPSSSTVRFQINLDQSPQINFKDLLKGSQLHSSSSSGFTSIIKKRPSSAVEMHAPPSCTNDDEDGSSEQHNRYNLIERLEKRYGSTNGMNASLSLSSVQQPSSSSRDKKKKKQDTHADASSSRSSSEESDSVDGQEDEFYDSEDSFIDDVELYRTIEGTLATKEARTIHEGFFVHSGAAIETTSDTTVVPRGHSPKSKKTKSKKTKSKQTQSKQSKSEDGTDAMTAIALSDDNKAGEKTSRDSKSKTMKKARKISSVKAFLAEYKASGMTWSVGDRPDLKQALAQLETKAREYLSTHPVTKVFPRSLDAELHQVDRLVVNAHEQHWRVHGYYAHLMHFLPYPKTCLQSSMVRLMHHARVTELLVERESFFVQIQQDILRASASGSTASAASGSTAAFASADTTQELWEQQYLMNRTLCQALVRGIETIEQWVNAMTDYQYVRQYLYVVMFKVQHILRRDNRSSLQAVDKKHLTSAQLERPTFRKEKEKALQHIMTFFPTAMNIDMTKIRLLLKEGKKKGVRRKQQRPTSVERKSSPSKETNKVRVKLIKTRRFDVCPIFQLSDFTLSTVHRSSSSSPTN